MPTVTLYADNDCYVEDDATTTVFNNGSLVAEWANIKSTITMRALLHFDVSSIPAGATIVSAVYNLYGQSALGSAQLDVERLIAAFAEGTATWAAQPAASTLVTTLTPPAGEGAASWKSFDITAAVANWLTGAWANDGVRVKAHDESTTSVSLQWDSDEGSNRPYLTVSYTTNTAPNAPTLTSPVGGAVIDDTASNTFTWTFSDPDVGDTQSAYELRYRLVGAGSWTTTGMVSSPTSSKSFAGATFAAGDYEWQVRTWDAIGTIGAFSASSFFTAAAPPAAPTITAPTGGATISASSSVVTWSAPNQASYQVRKVADAAGSPNTGTVYYDSGEVVSAGTRTAPLTFPTNNRYEHIQVRIKYLGLWSTWASVRVHVSFTPAHTPTLATSVHNVAGEARAITITITNAAPSGGEPTVVSNVIYRRLVGDTGAGERVATGVASSGAWTDWKIASLSAYQYQAVAIADNGTTASSAWTT